MVTVPAMYPRRTGGTWPAKTGVINTITASSREPWHLKSLTTRLFAQRFVQISNKTSTLRITGPLLRESIGHRWIPFTKGQWWRHHESASYRHIIKEMNGTWFTTLSLRHGGRETWHDLSSWRKQPTLPAAPAHTNSLTCTALIAQYDLSHHLMSIFLLIWPSFPRLVLDSSIAHTYWFD